MKKIFFLLSAIMLLSSCADIGLFHRKVKESSQVNYELVPPVIKEAFKQKHPEVLADEWYKVNNYMYAVKFELNNKKTYAFFSNAGTYIDDEDYDFYNNDLDDDYMEDWDYFNIDEY